MRIGKKPLTWLFPVKSYLRGKKEKEKSNSIEADLYRGSVW